jgi:hypothetical protein
MKLFFVRDKATSLYLEWERIKQNWVTTRDEASLYRTRAKAEAAIEGLENWERECEVVEIDTDAAVLVLRDLFDVRDLGDYTYDIREREGQGWKGDLVCKWGDAVERGRALVNEYERENAGNYDGP